jgi:hypothetical protein
LLDWTGGTLNFINSNFIPTIDTAAGGGNLASALTLGTGQLLTSNNENVGLNGTGTFTQTGGSNALTSALTVGVFSGSSGTYNLSGTGILSANEDIVGGNAAGLFNQSGGTNTVNILDVGFNPNSTGTYLLSGGTVNVQTVSVGDGDPGVKGVLSVSGSGLMNVTGTLMTVNTPGTGITLSGGTINTAALNVNGTASLFKWTGGTLGLTAGVTFDSAAASTSTSVAFGSSLTLGSNQTLNVTGNEGVGHVAAFSLTVNGGQNVVSGILTVDASSGTSTYTLSNGGSLAANGQDVFGVSEYIGFNGAAVFNQSGGTNAVSGEMDLGEFGTSKGIYLLSGGTLSAGSLEAIGFDASGLLNQSGGTNTVGIELDVAFNGGSSGTYNLSGGTLSSPNVVVGGFTNSGAGGTGVLTVSNTGLANVSGTLTAFNTPGSGITLGGGTINTAELDLNGTPSLLKWTSGTLGLTAGVAFDSTADPTTTGAAFGTSLALGSGQTLNVTGNETIGDTALFALTVSGGQNNVSGQLNLGNNAGSTGTYVLSNNGTLAVSGQENVGQSGTGTFNQSGGSNSGNGLLILANISTLSFGTYNLTGGSLAPAAGEIIGPGGHGVFNQTGGTNSFSSGFLAIGVFAGATGSFSLSGGIVTAQNAFVGGGRFGPGGTGVLAVSNTGIMNLSGSLTVYNTPGSAVTLSGGKINTVELDLAGSFAMTGGTLACGVFNQFSGTASFVNLLGDAADVSLYNQSGGTNTVSGFVALGPTANSSGTYNLSGGTLTSPRVYVGGSSNGAGGTGVLTVSNSGQLSVPTLLQVFNNGRVNLDVPNTAVGSLAIAGNGIVNLNGALAINYGTPANDPVTTIVGFLKSGFNGGAWNGTAGIISTSITGTSPTLSVGYADGKTDSGTAAGPNQIVVKYTLQGDANLDGLVNFNDLVAVVQNFNKAGTDWAQGNFLYGTSTNFNDLVAVVQNFNKVLPPPSGTSESGGITTIPLIQSTDVQLPEPGVMALVAIAGMGLLARRRRQISIRKTTGHGIEPGLSTRRL